MADVVEKPSLGYAKSTSGVDFQIPINLEDTFKNAKPPVVPPLFQSIVEEILARITSRQLSILPAPLSSLFANVEAMANDMLISAQVDDVIKMLHFGYKNLTEKQRILKRKMDLEPHRSSVLVRALFKYIQLCSGGIDLVVEFPSFGYLVTGPPPKEGGSFNLRAYTRSLELFLHNALEKSPIKRDIFCYFMRFLAEIYQWTSEAYRAEPALCVMTRHILASKFGPELFVLKCQSCDMRIDETNKGCEICLNVVKYIRPPYEAHIMNLMLEHSPSSYWKGMLSDPRPAIIGPLGERTKIEDLLFLRDMKSISKLADLPPLPKTVNRTSRLSSHGSMVNNGVSFLKVPEQSPSDRKSSGGDAEIEASAEAEKEEDEINDRRTSLLSGASGEHIFMEQRESEKKFFDDAPNEEAEKKVSGASGGSRARGILSSALIATKEVQASSSRASLFKHDSVKSVKSEASEVTAPTTTTSKAQKKATPGQRRPRSRARGKSKTRGSTGTRKSRKKTRSSSRKRKKGGGSTSRGRETPSKGKKNKKATAAGAKKKTPKAKQEQKKKKGGKNKRGKLKKR